MSDDKPTSARRTAARDVLRTAVAVLSLTNLLTTAHLVKATIDDPRDFLVYNGSAGPLAYREGSQEQATGLETALGPQQTVFHAGDHVSWTTNLCVAPGVGITGHAMLVRVAQSGVAEQVVDRRDTTLAGDAHRCGPRVGSFRFPVDALPGSYEIRRWVDIDPPKSGHLSSAVHKIWPLQVHMEPLVTQIVTTINTAPTAPTADN